MDQTDIENLFTWISGLYGKFKDSPMVKEIWLSKLGSYNLDDVKQAIKDHYASSGEYLHLSHVTGRLAASGKYRSVLMAQDEAEKERFRKWYEITYPRKKTLLESIMDVLGGKVVTEELRVFMKHLPIRASGGRSGMSKAIENGWVKDYREKLEELRKRADLEIPF